MHDEKHGCKQIVKLLSDYIDGECISSDRILIESHLADCPDCIAFVNTFRKSISMAKSLKYVDIPEDLRVRLHRVLEHKIRLEGTPPDLSAPPFTEHDTRMEDEDRL